MRTEELTVSEIERTIYGVRTGAAADMANNERYWGNNNIKKIDDQQDGSWAHFWNQMLLQKDIHYT